MKRYSLLQNIDERRCYVCGTTKDIHIHEVFHGNADRKKSIEHGCCVCLCARHHNMSDEGVHFNKGLDKRLKAEMERAFIKKHSFDEFMRVFRRNYILDEDEAPTSEGIDIADMDL